MVQRFVDRLGRRKLCHVGNDEAVGEAHTKRYRGSCDTSALTTEIA
jgi:hypothetical protein